jgi:hypothetical protein
MNDYGSDYLWKAVELDAAIIQREEYLMKGVITTKLHEVAEDVTEFLQTEDTILPKDAFFMNGSQTIH